MGRLIDLVRNNPQQVSALVAMCAVLLSFLSILLTVTALRLQRRHFLKSVTPIAFIRARDYENFIEVALENVGIGPLLIEQFRVLRGTDTKENVIDWMPEGLYWNNFTSIVIGRCIPAGKDIILLKFVGDLDDAEFIGNRDTVRSSLKDLHVHVNYRDIYGRPMPVASRSLDWFGRNLPTARELDPVEVAS